MIGLTFIALDHKLNENPWELEVKEAKKFGIAPQQMLIRESVILNSFVELGAIGKGALL